MYRLYVFSNHNLQFFSVPFTGLKEDSRAGSLVLLQSLLLASRQQEQVKLSTLKTNDFTAQAKLM